jgi:hypothetical protein
VRMHQMLLHHIFCVKETARKQFTPI